MEQYSCPQYTPINVIELNCAAESLGVRGFASSSQRLQTVSSEIQILNHRSVTSLGVRSLATGLQHVVHW